MRRGDLFGRILGAVVFLGGIAVLVFVFLTAYSFFTTQASEIKLPPPGGPPGTATAHLGRSAITLFAQILSLALMALVGSLVAGRGIQLYFHAANKAGGASNAGS